MRVEGRTAMYASIRRYQASDVTEIMARIKEGFVPIITGAPGFVSYYAIDGGHGTVASVSIFETKEGADESNRRAAEWVRANIAELVIGPPEIIIGEARVEATR
jgi:hypothetical protein